MPRSEIPEVFFYEELYHDLKTPIAIMFAYLQLMEHMSSMPSQALLYLQEAKKHCFRMAKLVRDANDGARISKGKLLPQFINSDIISLVEGLCEDARVLTDSKHISILFNSLIREKYMAVDRQMLERILLNLLSNAKQYSQEGAEIHVTVWEKSEDIYVSVRDYGPGVSKDMAQHMFSRGISSEEQGVHSGLGLYIVRELASLIGGEVYLADTKPGAEVVVRLPVFLTDAPEENPPVDDFFYDNMVQMELSF